MNDHDTITVACAADTTYAALLAVMVRSILETTEPDRRIRLFVLDAGLTNDDRIRLVSFWASNRIDVSWVDLDLSGLSGLPLWGRMRAVTYARLLMAERLPDSVKRVIWLDCDLVVNRDLGQLWAVELSGRPLCATQDLVVPYVSSKMGIAPYRELKIARMAPYFNAGVMLIDLGVWRAMDVSERAFKYLRTYARQVTLWDQEGLNVAIEGAWGKLDPRWNMIASVTGRSFFLPEHLDQAVYREAVRDPWIVHFAGAWKPWLLSRDNPFRILYFSRLGGLAWTNGFPDASLRIRLMRAYDSSLRNLLYGLEWWWLETVRWVSRRYIA